MGSMCIGIINDRFVFALSDLIIQRVNDHSELPPFQKLQFLIGDFCLSFNTEFGFSLDQFSVTFANLHI
jgi:hypothetical protein